MSVAKVIGSKFTISGAKTEIIQFHIYVRFLMKIVNNMLIGPIATAEGGTVLGKYGRFGPWNLV